MAKPKKRVEHPGGARARALRKRRGLTQAEAARRSGVLDRTEIVRIENGTNQATTERILAGLARAYAVPQLTLSAYLRGTRALDDLISGPTDEPGYAHAGNVEGAISYHPGRWRHETELAAKAIAVSLKEDPQPDEWKVILDSLEKAIESALPRRKR